MIFITVKWTIKPERTESWLADVESFTQATRNEPGNIFFEWARSTEDPNVFYVIEAFQDDAGGDHVGSDHFKAFVDWAPDAVAVTPSIVSQTVEGMDGWGEMGEVKPRGA